MVPSPRFIGHMVQELFAGNPTENGEFSRKENGKPQNPISLKTQTMRSTVGRPSTQPSKCRGWCVTINNYTQEDIDKLREIDCTYKVWGKEVAPTTNTPHLQAYFYWKNPISWNTVRAYFAPNHFEAAKGTGYENRKYCTKEGDFEEHGETPQEPAAAGKKREQERWENARAAAQAGRFDEIPADIYLRCYHTCKRIREDALMGGELQNTFETMYWYWGPPRTGKSRKAREENPGAYLKMCNKWWDNYKGEDVVIIEDFDRSHKVLLHHLKVWADIYPFQMEVKGGGVKIRPKKVIVTSNYHPADIWDEDVDLGPILGRFCCVHFPDGGTTGVNAGKFIDCSIKRPTTTSDELTEHAAAALVSLQEVEDVAERDIVGEEELAVDPGLEIGDDRFVSHFNPGN